eukprot:GHVT01032708.1.p1 GENE.GHVT01032708.1~~GHVT01032708.1.p1  ORF type:complete len:417 (-),score=44.09 GHVT01032708.1:749-1999(-)
MKARPLQCPLVPRLVLYLYFCCLFGMPQTEAEGHASTVQIVTGGGPSPRTAAATTPAATPAATPLATLLATPAAGDNSSSCVFPQQREGRRLGNVSEDVANLLAKLITLRGDQHLSEPMNVLSNIAEHYGVKPARAVGFQTDKPAELHNSDKAFAPQTLMTVGNCFAPSNNVILVSAADNEDRFILTNLKGEPLQDGGKYEAVVMDSNTLRNSGPGLLQMRQAEVYYPGPSDTKPQGKTHNLRLYVPACGQEVNSMHLVDAALLPNISNGTKLSIDRAGWSKVAFFGDDVKPVTSCTADVPEATSQFLSEYFGLNSANQINIRCYAYKDNKNFPEINSRMQRHAKLVYVRRQDLSEATVDSLDITPEIMKSVKVLKPGYIYGRTFFRGKACTANKQTNTREPPCKNLNFTTLWNRR